jgi:NADPH2:quinone reductase
MRVTAAGLVQHGQPLKIQEAELARPGDQETVMQVAFSGVNPIDLYASAGRAMPEAPVPRTLGTEGAGTVDGRPVMVGGYGIGTVRDGLWESAAVVPRAALIEIPDGVELAEAAAMGVAGIPHGALSRNSPR